MSTTTRWGIPYPALTDAADVPQWMHDLAVSLDNVAKDDQGILSARPAAGNKGFYYHATDDTTGGPDGTLYRDNGTKWVQVVQDGGVHSRHIKPTTGVVRDSSALALTSAYQDVPGLSLSVTPDVASRVLVVVRVSGSVVLSSSPFTGYSVFGQLVLDGVVVVDAANPFTRTISTAAPSGSTVTLERVEVFDVPLTAAAHVLKVQAKDNAASAPHATLAGSISYTLVAQ